MTRILVGVVGVATIYAGQYVSQPLYCDTGIGLRYEQGTSPWVALDVNEFTSGRAQCGDELWLHGDGWQLRALALDAGPLEGHYVEDWPGLPILVDVPAFLAPFPGLSARVRPVNTSAVKRRMEGLR